LFNSLSTVLIILGRAVASKVIDCPSAGFLVYTDIFNISLCNESRFHIINITNDTAFYVILRLHIVILRLHIVILRLHIVILSEAKNLL